MLAGAADQEQHDAVDVVVLDRAGRLLGQEAGQRQAERGQGAGVQEVAAGQAVAEGNGTRCVQSQHTAGAPHGGSDERIAQAGRITYIL